MNISPIGFKSNPYSTQKTQKSVNPNNLATSFGMKATEETEKLITEIISLVPYKYHKGIFRRINDVPFLKVTSDLTWRLGEISLKGEYAEGHATYDGYIACKASVPIFIKKGDAEVMLETIKAENIERLTPMESEFLFFQSRNTGKTRETAMYLKLRLLDGIFEKLKTFKSEKAIKQIFKEKLRAIERANIPTL